MIHLNTSHVILYPEGTPQIPFAKIFKYISCYSLSEKYGTNYKHLAHLNTSHVILYLTEFGNIKELAKDLNTSHVILYQNKK